MSRHIVGSQIMETRFDNESEAFRLQNKISQISDGSLKRKIEETIDAVFGPDEHFRFERILLDVGPIAYEALEDELIERVCERLRVALGDAKLKVLEGRGGKDARTVSPSASLSELIEHFLLKGYLPWWAFHQGITIADAMRQLIEDSPDELANLLKRVGKYPNARRRLMTQFDSETLELIARSFEKQNAEFLSDFVEALLAANLDERFSQADTTTLRLQIWESIFDYLFDDTRKHFNKRAFLKRSLDLLATYTGVEYGELVLSIDASIQTADASLRFSSDLLESIGGLTKEERAVRSLLKEEDVLAFDRLRVLRIYLKTGALPWRFPIPSGESLADWVAMLFDDEPEVLRGLVEEVSGHQHELLRLVALARDEDVATIGYWLESRLGGLVEAFVRLLDRILRNMVPQAATLKKEIWIEALLALSQVKSGTSLPKDYLSSLFLRIEERFNIEGYRLLYSIQKYLDTGESSQVEDSDEIASVVSELIGLGGKGEPSERMLSPRALEFLDTLTLSTGAKGNQYGRAYQNFNDGLALIIQSDTSALKSWLCTDASPEVFQVLLDRSSMENLEKLIEVIRPDQARELIPLLESFVRKSVSGRVELGSVSDFKNELLRNLTQYVWENRASTVDPEMIVRIFLYRLAEIGDTQFFELLKDFDSKETGDPLSETIDGLVSNYGELAGFSGKNDLACDRVAVLDSDQATDTAERVSDEIADSDNFVEDADKRLESAGPEVDQIDKWNIGEWVSIHDAVQSRLLGHYIPYWAVDYRDEPIEALLDRWIAVDSLRSIAKLREWSVQASVYDTLVSSLDTRKLLETSPAARLFRDEHKTRFVREIKTAIDALRLSSAVKEQFFETFHEIVMFELLADTEGSFDKQDFLLNVFERVSWKLQLDIEALRLSFQEVATDADIAETIEQIGEIRVSLQREYEEMRKSLADSGSLSNVLDWVLPGGSLSEMGECIQILFSKKIWQGATTDHETKQNLSSLLHLVAKRRGLSLDDTLRLFRKVKRLPDAVRILIDESLEGKELSEPERKGDSVGDEYLRRAEAYESPLAQRILSWALEGVSEIYLKAVLDDLIDSGRWRLNSSRISNERNLSHMVLDLSERLELPVNTVLQRIRRQNDLESWEKRQVDILLSKSWENVESLAGRSADSSEEEEPGPPKEPRVTNLQAATKEEAYRSSLAKRILTWKFDSPTAIESGTVLDQIVEQGLWALGNDRESEEKNLTLFAIFLADSLKQPLSVVFAESGQLPQFRDWEARLIDSLRILTPIALKERRSRVANDAGPKSAVIEIADQLEPPADANDRSYRKEEPRFAETREALQETVYISNSGLVLLHPYLKLFLSRLGLVQDNEFKNVESRIRAVGLLQYLVTGLDQWEEHHLVLNKIFCGLPVNHPVDTAFDFTTEEMEMSNGLLNAFIGHWPVLKSIAGLRGDWLVRDGRLSEGEERLELVVENKPYDLLLEKCPVGLSIINFNWMPKPLTVQWN